MILLLSTNFLVLVRQVNFIGEISEMLVGEIIALSADDKNKLNVGSLAVRLYFLWQIISPIIQTMIFLRVAPNLSDQAIFYWNLDSEGHVVCLPHQGTLLMSKKGAPHLNQDFHVSSERANFMIRWIGKGTNFLAVHWSTFCLFVCIFVPQQYKHFSC